MDRGVLVELVRSRAAPLNFYSHESLFDEFL